MQNKLILGLIVIILFAACKKDKDESEVSLIGKWNVENSIFKIYENGVLIDTETEAGDGTTFDFQDNGNLIIATPGSDVESVPYTIKADSKVEIDGALIEIRNLTRSNVTLFGRQDYAPGEYDEVFFNLKR